MIEVKNDPDFLGLPQGLQPLRVLSGNLYWTWDRRISRVFERIDPERWNRENNPVQLIKGLSPARIEELSRDESFLTDLSIANAVQRGYVSAVAGSWFVKRSEERRVALLLASADVERRVIHVDRKSTRLNSSHYSRSRMPSSA